MKSKPVKTCTEEDFPDISHTTIRCARSARMIISMQCLRLRHRYEPEDILMQLAAIEDRHGRVRGKIRNSARTLDLDLLLVGNYSVHSRH